MMENLYTDIKPFYYFAKILGLFPMSFVGSARKGILKTKIHDAIYSLLAFVTLGTLLILKISLNNNVRTSKLMFVAFEFSMYLEFFMLAIQFIFQICKRNDIRFCLSMLDAFDNEVSFVMMKLIFV